MITAVSGLRPSLRWAAYSGVLASLVWFAGAPLVAMSGIMGPTDAEAGVVGMVSAALGLTLLPLMASLFRADVRLRKFLAVSGSAIAVSMVVFGGLSVAGATGHLQRIAGPWMPNAAFGALLALFAWMLPASWAARGPSTIQRYLFWVGMVTAGLFLSQVLALTLVYFLLPSFTFTNATAAVGFFLDLGLWVLFPMWIIGLAIRAAAK